LWSRLKSTRHHPRKPVKAPLLPLWLLCPVEAHRQPLRRWWRIPQGGDGAGSGGSPEGGDGAGSGGSHGGGWVFAGSLVGVG
jgi:hypothetical protein